MPNLAKVPSNFVVRLSKISKVQGNHTERILAQETPVLSGDRKRMKVSCYYVHR
jgi:hypothetical protein